MSITNISIPDDQYYEVLTCINYPILQESDFGLTRVQVEKLAILPAIREYYKWFPQELKQQEEITQNFSIDFPTDQVYSVLHAGINNYNDGGIGYAQGGILSNLMKYADSDMYRNSRAYWDNQYKELERQSILNKKKVIRYDVDEINKKLVGYSNFEGQLTITWALWDSDFTKIPFIRLDEVIMMCQSKLSGLIARRVAMMKSNLPVEIDADFFKDQATDLRDEVLPNWQKVAKTAIVKM